MPAQLVILTDDVLVDGDQGVASTDAEFEALARLGHAGYAVAVICSRSAVEERGAGADPHTLQDLAQEAGGQVAAFFHRAPGDGGLADALADAARRWPADLGLVPCVAGNVTDLATIATCGGRPVSLGTHLAADGDLPDDCRHHPDLGAFVTALLDEQGTAS